MLLKCPSNTSCFYLTIMLEKMLAYRKKKPTSDLIGILLSLQTVIGMNKSKDSENLFTFLKTITLESGEVGKTLSLMGGKI